MTQTHYIENNQKLVDAAPAGNLGDSGPSIPVPYIPQNDGSPTYDPSNSGIWAIINGEDPHQVLIDELTYYDNHPTNPMAIANLTNTIMYMVQNGLFTSADADQLNQVNAGDLMKDVVDQLSMYAFLYGYPNSNPPTPSSNAGQWSSVQNYMNALQQSLSSVQPSNSFLDGMIQETNVILSSEKEFMESHSAGYDGTAIPAQDAAGNPIAQGDIIFSYTLNGKTFYYDFTSASKNNDTNALNAINTIILNASGASGDDHRDIDYLDSNIGKLQTLEALDTFDTVLKETGGDVGVAILAMIYSMEGSKLNQLSGNADTMDKQTKLSSAAKALEDYLNGLTSDPNGTDAGAAGNFRGSLLSLFSQIQASSQFEGLDSSVTTAITTFSNTQIPFPAGATTTRSVWDLATDPNVTNAQLEKALTSALTPNPGSSGTAPPTSALQGLLGGIDGVVTSVSSASTQANTIAAQLESLIQAMDKVMTGVIDPNNGMNTAVIKNALSHQTGN